jgi:hypothetical protein
MAVNNFIPEIWASAILENFHQANVLIPALNRQYEGEARVGNVVNITSFTDPSIQDYSRTGSLTVDDLSDSTIPLAIDQQRAFAFRVDDVDRVQAAGSFEPVTRGAGAALAEDAESYVIDLLINDGSSIGTTAPADADEAFASVLELRQALVEAKVPSQGRILVVNPTMAALLLGTDSKLSNVSDSGNEDGLRNGVIGRLLGFTVVEHPQFEGGASAIAFHRDSVAYVGQIAKVEAARMENAFADVVKALNVYGAAVLRPDAVQTLIAASSS